MGSASLLSFSRGNEAIIATEIRPNPETRSAAPTRAAGLAPRTASEALGSTLLLAIVVGSGIMAERLSSGNAAIALLSNAVATEPALLPSSWRLGVSQERTSTRP